MTRSTGPQFPPPADPALLYVGSVMHARMRPVVHRFTYSVFNLLIDVGALDAAGRLSRLFSIDGFNLTSFSPKDHGPRDGSCLKTYALDVLRQAGLDLDDGRVLLLCYPRILGFVFNPISVYFVYDRSDQLRGVLYEVRNTFGEHHTYAAPIRPGELSDAGLRQERDKLFYVSPFNGMRMRYHFRVLPPGRDTRIRILETEAGAPLLAATFNGSQRPLRSGIVLSLVARIPLLTMKVVAGIHYEALRLWWKGLRLQPRPPAPAPLSFPDPGGDDRYSPSPQFRP
jgi:DUF1365 family protein